MGETVLNSDAKIQVTPPSPLEIPTGSQRPVTIKNVGSGVLNVNEVWFEDTSSSSSAFELIGLPSSRPFSIQPNRSVNFQVKFQATQAGSQSNSLVIESNDPQDPQLRYQVKGEYTGGKVGPTSTALTSEAIYNFIGNPSDNALNVIETDFEIYSGNKLQYGVKGLEIKYPRNSVLRGIEGQQGAVGMVFSLPHDSTQFGMGPQVEIRYEPTQKPLDEILFEKGGTGHDNQEVSDVETQSFSFRNNSAAGMTFNFTRNNQSFREVRMFVKIHGHALIFAYSASAPEDYGRYIPVIKYMLESLKLSA
jgi:hypothetical protein